MKSALFAAVLALLSCAQAGAAGPANLVSNGSFEDAPASPGHWVIVEAIPGWQGDPEVVGGLAGGIEIQNQGFENIRAQDGVNLVELDTYRNSWMTQTIQATGWVRLSFWYAARAGWGAGTQDLGFGLGTLSGSVLQGVAGGTSVQWQHYVGLADLGSSGSAVLRFAAQGQSDMAGGLLDNVSVTAVPEPQAAALWLAGLGLLGALRRRRRRITRS
ncbi:PEP-CTERM sorting domain-containing protein [Aquabacterium sp. OR-4]|uniref:PEP-CTERM sorting domain-containing protein n=1 Tax=Aquabacterium sp. OR-4 TaxID=2978127 RepID=UPI0028CA0813|nr:PEP-CTERM sorting domain-containing protein [Aquabacterium sp. OR-4]MDT7838856.1 PEP-CTERM sorting domain-containing protein [Aquabacterium sp. OR-4]